jgi:hypothetical protein
MTMRGLPLRAVTVAGEYPGFVISSATRSIDAVEAESVNRPSLFVVVASAAKGPPTTPTLASLTGRNRVSRTSPLTLKAGADGIVGEVDVP